MLFPHNPRPYQLEAVKKIAEATKKGRNFLLQAPTGFGKTPVVLAALLPLDKKIIWITRTGNESNRPVEELRKINEKFDKDFLGLSFRGKVDMCPFSEEYQIKDYEALAELCEDCPLGSSKDFTMKGALSFSQILRTGKGAGLCPYKLQFKLAKDAKLISMSYNYILSDLFGFLKTITNPSEAILVIDEAHNLQKAAGEINSSKLTLMMIRRTINELRSFKDKKLFALSMRVKRLIDDLDAFSRKEETINPIEVFKKSGLSEADLEDMLRLSLTVYEKQREAAKPLRSYMRNFATFWKKAVSSYRKEGVVVLKSSDQFTILDMRVQEILGPLWAEFSNSIFISGTLKPIRSFAELMGLKDYGLMEIPSFSASVHPFIVRGVTTRGTKIDDVQKGRYNLLLDTFFDFNGNSAVFFASYRIQRIFLEKIIELTEIKGKPLYVERPGMSGDEAHTVLEKFKGDKSAVLLASMSGRFSEGTDFPGSALEAIMLLGVPFERYSLKAKLMIEYYTKCFGDKGRHYGYVIPAIRRASQALGRAIRSPQDFGLFVLADERYMQYQNLLPDFVERNVRVVHYTNFPFLIRQFID